MSPKAKRRKLDARQVRSIRERYRRGTATQRQLADEHGVSQAHVQKLTASDPKNRAPKARPRLDHDIEVPRYAWPRAEDALRSRSIAYEALALTSRHAVLLRVTAKGARALTSAGIGAEAVDAADALRDEPPRTPPEPEPERHLDPMQQALARLRDEIAAGERPGLAGPDAVPS